VRKNRAMVKPSPKQPTQADYIKTALRLPPSLHAELKDSAEKNGRTMNAEIIARLLQLPVNAQLDNLAKDQRQLVAIAKEILAAVGGR
jgi:hypothetical protein